MKKPSLFKLVTNFFIALDVFRFRKYLLNFFGEKIGDKFALTTLSVGDFNVREFKEKDFKENEVTAFITCVCTKPKK